jgi:hypothetical protein
MARLLWTAALVCGGGAVLVAAPAPERIRLYTQPDPSASGGINGTIVTPAKPIEQILAMPPDEPTLVYQGEISGTDRRTFLFKNLPMARYNLFVIYKDEFYEGLELNPGPDTLTNLDRDKIKSIVSASDPFFTVKVFHRISGTTGRGNTARCLVTQYRDREALDAAYNALKGFRRTFKLIWLKDVGPGWQVVQKRDLYPLTVDAAGLNPRHHYAAGLSKIRVTNSMKELGQIELGKP